MSRTLTQITMDFGPEPELSTPPVMEAVVREHSLIPQYVTIPSAGVIVRFKSLKDPSIDLQSWVLPKQPDTPFRVNYLRAVPLTERTPVVDEPEIPVEEPVVEVAIAPELSTPEPETLVEEPAEEVGVDIEDPTAETVIEEIELISAPELPEIQETIVVLESEEPVEELAAEPEIVIEELEEPVAAEPEALAPEIEEPVAEPEVSELVTPEAAATVPAEIPAAKVSATATAQVPKAEAPAGQPESLYSVKPFPQLVNGSLFGDMEVKAPEHVEAEPTHIKSLRPPVQVEEEEEITEEEPAIVETLVEAPATAETTLEEQGAQEMPAFEELVHEEAFAADPVVEEPIVEEAIVEYTEEPEAEVAELAEEAAVYETEAPLATETAETEEPAEAERIDRMAAPAYTEQIGESAGEIVEKLAEEIEEEEGWDGPEEESATDSSENEDESNVSNDLEAEPNASIDAAATESAEAEAENEDALLRRRTPSKPAAAKPAIPGKRGRKSLKQVAAEADLIEIPEDEVLFSKQYYTMGEVSEMFKVNQSLLRFWETEFDILQPRKNKKGDRYFRPLDIKNLHLIYHLLRQKKYTIEGAKEFLKKNKKAEERFEVIRRLQEIRTFLLDWKGML